MKPEQITANESRYGMKCLPTHQTASCFKFYPSGKFKAPMNNPLHKQSSSVHFAKFTNLVIIAARQNSKLLKITSAERTSYSACSQVSITDVVVNTMRSTSIRHAMFQNTSKVNSLFSNIFFCKVLQFSSKNLSYSVLHVLEQNIAGDYTRYVS